MNKSTDERGCCSRLHSQCELLTAQVNHFLFGPTEASRSERALLRHGLGDQDAGIHLLSDHFKSSRRVRRGDSSELISDLSIAVGSGHDKQKSVKRTDIHVNGSGTRMSTRPPNEQAKRNDAEQHPRGSQPLQERHTVGFIPRENSLDIQLPLALRCKYKLGGLVGIGTSSKCYLATRRSDGCEFACKIIDTRKLAMTHPPGVVEQFKSEISTLELLNHPNIIKLHDHYDMPNQIFIVLELVRGGELFDRIVKQNGLSESDAKHVFKSVCGALAYMHSMDVMHRDVKPENVLLVSNQSSDVKIIDFGFSKVMTGGSQYAKSFMGTGGFLAPELRHSTAYTKAVDMWSLGVTLYVMLSGNLPFDIGVERRHSHQNSHYQLRFPAKQWGHVSEQAKDLLSKLLTIDSDRRITAHDAMQHAWVSSTPSALDSHQNYYQYSRAPSESVSSVVSASANSILGMLRKGNSNLSGGSGASGMSSEGSSSVAPQKLFTHVSSGTTCTTDSGDEGTRETGASRQCSAELERNSDKRHPDGQESSDRNTDRHRRRSSQEKERATGTHPRLSHRRGNDVFEGDQQVQHAPSSASEDTIGGSGESVSSVSSPENKQERNGSFNRSSRRRRSPSPTTSDVTSTSNGSISSDSDTDAVAPPTPYRGPVGARNGMLQQSGNNDPILFRSRSMPCMILSSARRATGDNNTSPFVNYSPIVVASHSVHGGHIFGSGVRKRDSLQALFRRDHNLSPSRSSSSKSEAMNELSNFNLCDQSRSKNGRSFLLAAAMEAAGGDANVHRGQLFGATSWASIDMPLEGLPHDVVVCDDNVDFDE
jgi:calcium/calmodulin-dependent protein kinase I